MGLLLKEQGRDLAIKGMGGPRVLNAAFASVFTGKTGTDQARDPDTSGKVWWKVDLPSLDEDFVGGRLNRQDKHKFCRDKHEDLMKWDAPTTT